jgi:Ser/Thr protein kinase RdoA (MazF antagonist)
MSQAPIPPEYAEIAAQAVTEFLAEESRLVFLSQGESVACRVEAPSGMYLLRIHAPISTSPAPDQAIAFSVAGIESECTWLLALARETSVVVQRPVLAPHGGHVLQLPFGSNHVLTPCTMLHWLEGDLIEGERTPDQAFQLGELLAALRSHAESWKRPANFVRLAHGMESWWASIHLLDGLVNLGVIPEAGRQLLTDVVGMADRELKVSGSRPEAFGLIHADLHESNYLLHAGQLRPIDFGRAGIGPWFLDLAESLGHLTPARRLDLVNGYSRHHPLKDGDIRLIEGYFVGALVEYFGYHAPVPADHADLTRGIKGWSKYFEYYLAGKPFLFGFE